MRKHFPLPLPLVVILAAYFLIGGFSALRVPAWQTPDEPAHYNYIRQLAQTGAFPVIEMGDYDQQFLAEKVQPPKVRPDVPLDTVQYEDHQPPLFYALAVPVFALFQGALLPLRLLSLLIGSLAVVLAYATLRAIFPAAPSIAAFAAAFVALLPQRLHMMSGLNNDCLSEALIALALYLCVRLLLGGSQPGRRVLRALVALGVVVGLSFITKVTAYLTFPLALVAVAAAMWKRYPARAVLAALGVVAGLGLLFGLPWWLHGIQVYGGLDALGLARHNQVVVGQPTTADWLKQYGAGGLLARMAQTTFQSFWGQFGWMSIPLNTWMYLLLLAFAGLSAVLFLAWLAQSLRRGSAVHDSLTREQRLALGLLAVLALGGLLGFAWYNLQFVQHQGRYLYAGLIPIAAGMAIGWHFAFSRWPRLQGWLWLALAAAMAGFDAYLLWRVILPGMAA